MNLLATKDKTFFESEKINQYPVDNTPLVFTDIYEKNCNITIWKRNISRSLNRSVNEFLNLNYRFQIAMALSPEEASASIHKALGGAEATKALSDDIAELVDMFCCLFGLQHAGLRLAVLDKAMCPKFHVDRVPCRLITTYHGVATQWLRHNAVDRSKLGRGSQGKPDSESGIYSSPQDIQQLNYGDVALLKGEAWQDNEGAGLVHRSPDLVKDEKRLLLTLDMM